MESKSQRCKCSLPVEEASQSELERVDLGEKRVQLLLQLLFLLLLLPGADPLRTQFLILGLELASLHLHLHQVLLHLLDICGLLRILLEGWDDESCLREGHCRLGN